MLIADDNDDMRALLRVQLELAGVFEVVAEAVDGIDALSAFDHLGGPPVPDVVLVDNRMPNVTGLELAVRLTERVPTQRIVLFTAFADGEPNAGATSWASTTCRRTRLGSCRPLR